MTVVKPCFIFLMDSIFLCLEIDLNFTSTAAFDTQIMHPSVKCLAVRVLVRVFTSVFVSFCCGSVVFFPEVHQLNVSVFKHNLC